MTPKAWETKEKIQWDYVKLKASAQQKNDQQNEKATYGKGENIYKSYIW